MTTIESEKIIINRPQPEVFSFLADFNHFEKLMPEQVVNWKSDADSCSFTIRGMTDVSLRITDRIPFSKIIIDPQGMTQLHLQMMALTAEKTNSKTEAQMIIIADFNAFQSLLMVKPLTNLANIMVNRLREVCEQ
jgi:hypothetical protein